MNVRLLLLRASGIALASEPAETADLTALHATAMSRKLGCLEENNDFDRRDPRPGNGYTNLPE